MTECICPYCNAVLASPHQYDDGIVTCRSCRKDYVMTTKIVINFQTSTLESHSTDPRTWDIWGYENEK